MKKIILLVATSLVLFSCNQLAEGEYIISGKIKGMKTGLIYLEKQNPMGMGITAIDTVKITDGAFEIKGKTTEPEIHFIQVDKVNGKVPLILEGGKITVEVDKDSIFKSKAAGTYSNDEFTKFTAESNKMQKKLQPKLMAFQMQNKTLIEEAQKNNDTVVMNKLKKEYDLVQKEMTDYTFDYPKTHPKSFISVLIAQAMLNNPNFSPAEIEKVYNSLDETLKKTKPGKSLKQNLDESKKKPAVK